MYIATDSKEIKEVCESFTKNIILTKSTHQSGTDRVGEAVATLDCDVVINVQGDEPFIDPVLVEELINLFKNKETTMASAMSRIDNLEDLQSTNVVKVVTDHQKNALYFSRSPIPFPRDHKEMTLSDQGLKRYPFFRHIGIYGYRRDFLLDYVKMHQSTLEKIEKLEQLRVLENGYTIKMLEAASDSTGIDTMEDYQDALKKY